MASRPTVALIEGGSPRSLICDPAGVRVDPTKEKESQDKLDKLDKLDKKTGATRPKQGPNKREYSNSGRAIGP